MPRPADTASSLMSIDCLNHHLSPTVQQDAQRPNHVGRFKQVSADPLAIKTVDRARCLPKASQCICGCIAAWNACLLAEIVNGGDSALDQPSLLERREARGLVGGPDELGDEGGGQGHVEQGIALTVCVNHLAWMGSRPQRH